MKKSSRPRLGSSISFRRLFRFEALESRLPLAGDLAVINAYLVDVNAAPVAGVVEGDAVLARVNYTTTGLDPTVQYKMTMELDGVPRESEVLFGANGTGLQYYHYYHIGFASAGSHVVKVTLDSSSQIPETNEGNNVIQFNFTPSKAVVPQKFLVPVVGSQTVDSWTIVNYVDEDVRPNTTRDYRSGFMTYDGHVGIDFGYAPFSMMDEGRPVFAAADGVVIETLDGNFDREDYFDLANIDHDTRIGNHVIIDHGGGWKSLYWHFQRDTITVKVGEVVKAGQVLGLIGSSGISDWPHVHFQVNHNDLAVDPFLAPSDYWLSPPGYVGDSNPKAMTLGITDRDPTPDFRQGPNDIQYFQLNGTENPWLYYRLEYVRKNDQFVTDWIRPNGTIYFHDVWSSPVDLRYIPMWHSYSAVDMVGNWTVVAKRNGIEVARRNYTVVSGLGAPEIEIRQNTTLVIDGRTTPMSFGTVAQNSIEPEVTFSIINQGTAPLDIVGVSVPQGFQIVGAAPTQVAVNQTASLRLKMLTNEIDHQWGDVVLLTNDTDEGKFIFAVEGFVTGNRNSNAPSLSSSTLGLVIEKGQAATPLFPQVTLTDSDTVDFQGSRINAEIISNPLEDGTDRLLYLPTSSDWKTIQNTVYFQGQPIALILQDGSLGRFELQMMASSSRSQVDQLARSIAFWQQSTNLSYRRRIAEIKVIDPFNLSSQSLQRAVFYGQNSLNQPPFFPTLTDRTIAEDQILGPIDLQVTDLNDSLASLTVVANSSNTAVVANENLQVSFAGGKWQLLATPLSNVSGSTVITVSATDASGSTYSSAFNLTVTATNDLPTITAIGNQSTSQIASLPPIPFQISDVESDSSLLQLSATSTNLNLINTSGIVFDGTGTDRTVTLTPTAGRTGTSTIKITVTDPDGGQKSASFTYTVTAETIPPTLDPISNQNIFEDNVVSVPITIGDNYTPLDQLVLSATSSNVLVLPISGITFGGSGATRQMQMQPLADASGSSQVVVTVRDLAGNTAKQTFTVDVQAVNDPPSFTSASSVTANEDSAVQSINLLSIVSGGNEQQPLSISAAPESADFFESLSTEYTSPLSTGKINWKPAANRFGSSSIVITLTDGGLDRDLSTSSDNLMFVKTVSVTVVAVNDAPTIDPVSNQTANEDSGEQVTSVTGIGAGPGETQNITLLASPTNPSLFATLQLSGVDGNNAANLRWTPSPNSFGTSEVRIIVTDSGLDGDMSTIADNLSTVRTFTITVTPVNDLPSFTLVDTAVTLPEDSGNQANSITSVSAGIGESQALKWSVIANPSNAIEFASVDYTAGQNNATLRWKPAKNYFGAIELVVTLADSGLDNDLLTAQDNGTYVSTVVVSVISVNDAPSQMTLPSGPVPENTNGFVLGPIQVTDVDDNSFVFTTSDPRFVVESGVLKLDSNASFNFEAEPSVNLSVTVSDPNGGQLTKAATIQIQNKNDPASQIKITPYTFYQEIQQQTIGTLTVVDPDVGQTHLLQSLDSRFTVAGGQLKLVPGSSIAAGVSQVSVQLRATDTSVSPISTDIELVLQVTSVSSPWLNPANSLDVTANNLVSPSDALQIINYLNSGASKILNATNNPPLATGPFLDTNGDRMATPADALKIINYLNANRPEGEFAESSASKNNVIEESNLHYAAVVDQFLVEFTDDLQRKAKPNRRVG
ncbi:MAG: peptidoglycan DD-metalloendopeptidase family protein [Pirellulales bacterium]